MNPQNWPFLFDLHSLKPQTQAYLKRVSKKLYPGQPLEDIVFSRREGHQLRKRGIASLLLIGAMAKDGRVDHESSRSYSPPFDAAKALLNLDIPLLINLEPGVDWKSLVRAAARKAIEADLYDWYANPDEAYSEYAGYESHRIVEIVSLRACASLHSHAGDNLNAFMPFDISHALFSFGTSLPELFRAITWLKSWEAAERAKDNHTLAASWKDELIKAVTNRFAFIWHLQGHGVEEIVSYLRSVLPEVIQFAIPTCTVEISDLITDVRVAHFLSSFPDHWDMDGFQVEHMLGVPYGSFEGDYDYTLHSLAEGFVHREGSYYDLQGPIIKHLHALDPRICSAEHVDRMGTRQLAWTDLVNDWKPAAEKLNSMLQKKIWHPALHGLNAVELLDGEASAAAALAVYLADGGNGNRKRAEHLLERFPEVVDAALPGLKKKQEIQRIASIATLTSAQIQQLPGKHRDIVFSVDLGL